MIRMQYCILSSFNKIIAKSVISTAAANEAHGCYNSRAHSSKITGGYFIPTDDFVNFSYIYTYL